MKLIKLINEYYIIKKGNIEVGEIGMHYMNQIDISGNYTFQCVFNTGIERHKYHSHDTELLTEHCYKIIASTNELENVPLLNRVQIETLLKVDVLKLAVNSYESTKTPKGENTGEVFIDGFRKGYNQALENNADKKFTLGDISKILLDVFNKTQYTGEKMYHFYNDLKETFIQSLTKEQTEWDIEVEMEVPVQIREVGKPVVKSIKITNGYINILKIN